MVNWEQDTIHVSDFNQTNIGVGLNKVFSQKDIANASKTCKLFITFVI